MVGAKMAAYVWSMSAGVMPGGPTIGAAIVAVWS